MWRGDKFCSTTPGIKIAENYSMESVVISDKKEKLIRHSLYSQISTLRDVQIFMESHVFAVWDFMSLLKNLQTSLTCTRTPWMPVGTPATRFFINEIVLGEESDVDPEGNYTSHFELYLKAMEECGASTACIHAFIKLLGEGCSVKDALKICHAPAEAAKFVNCTFDLLENKSVHEIAALFAYGREDLIPGMFISMVDILHAQHQNLSCLIYYLKRHIELDGDHHGRLSAQMTQELVGNDPVKGQEVIEIIDLGYQQRIDFWDGIVSRIYAEKHN
jgi:hypothetical protein